MAHIEIPLRQHSGNATEGQNSFGRWYVRITGWHPTRLNVLLASHWAKAARLKAADALVVRAACLGADVSRADARRRISLEIGLAKGQRGGDPDCYWKSLLDALVNCGALVDDSREWCDPAGVTYTRGTLCSIITIEHIGQIQDNIPLTPGRAATPVRMSKPRKRRPS
jgi:hypothetical protein